MLHEIVPRPGADAEKSAVAPGESVTHEGATETVADTRIVACPDFEVFATDVAVIEYVPAAEGAVTTPAAETVAGAAALHVTAWLEIGSPLTSLTTAAI